MVSRRGSSHRLQRPKFHTHSHLHVCDAHTRATAATTSMEDVLTHLSTRSRLKTRLAQTSNPKLLFAGGDSESGAAITDPEVAKAWTHFFQQCGLSTTFEVGDLGPSLNDIQPLLSKLAELDSDIGCSTRAFQDSEGRRWLVEIISSENRVTRLKDHNDELERHCRSYHKQAQEREAQGLSRSNSGTLIVSSLDRETSVATPSQVTMAPVLH